MNWIAYMKDGNIIRETQEFPFNQLDFDNIERFRLTESGSNIAVPFSCDSGIIRFTNLDLQKMRGLSDKEELKFEFNKEMGFFQLNPESMRLYESIMLNEEKDYYFIEFDQTGVFNINGEKLYTGFQIGEELIEFKDNPPYTDIIQYKNGFSEIKMRGNKPVNKNDKTINYVVGYRKQHIYNDLEFDLKYQIIYDLMNRYVMLDFIMQSNKDTAGKIFLSYGGRTSGIPVRLTASSPMQTKRVLTVIG